MANLKRNILLNFRVTEQERDLIAEKMTAAGIQNRSSVNALRSGDFGRCALHKIHRKYLCLSVFSCIIVTG